MSRPLRVRRRRKPAASRQPLKSRGMAVQEERLSPKGATNHVPAIRQQGQAPAVQAKFGLEDQKRQVNFQNYHQLGINFSYEMLDMVLDPVKRTFKDKNEFHDYVAGKTDYIGDVPGKGFWVRLDKDKFHVIGEFHRSASGNFVDIAKAVNTERFMYEPLHDAEGLKDSGSSKNRQFGTTGGMLQDKKDQSDELGAQVGKFNPTLENIAVKTIPIYHFIRKMVRDVRADPARLDNFKSKGNLAAHDINERVAHYFRYVVTMAMDTLTWQVPPTSAAFKFGRHYQQNQLLFGLMAIIRQWGGRSIHIGDMLFDTSPAALDALEKFAGLGHDFVTEYLLDLARQKGDKNLEKIAKKLQGTVDKNPFGPGSDVNKAREWFMVENLKRGKPQGYLLAGMGDRHRRNLQGPHRNLADTWIEATNFLRRSTNKARMQYNRFSP